MRWSSWLGVLVVALLPGSAAVADGTLPDESYSPDQRYALITSNLGSEHHNQSAVVNGWLLLAGNGVHSMWDISDPFRPARLSDLTSPHHDGEAESHQVATLRDGDRFLAATISGRGVDLWDLTDAESPELLSALELEGINYGDNSEAVWGVSWQGDYLFVGGTNTGLHVVDTTDPRNPSVLTRLPTSAFGGVSAGPLWAIGNLLVVTTPKNHAGIATLDIGDPADPSPLDFVAPDPDSYIGHFYGAHAYLLTPFRSYDVTTDPSAIRLVNSVETPKSEYLSFGDGHLFLGRLRPNPGVTKYALGDGGALRAVGSIEGRRTILMGIFTDDQFPLPIGNLLVLSDDEMDLGSVLAVHDERRDSQPPELLYANPPDGATSQPLTTRIGLSFSDQIDLRSVDPSTVIVRPVGGTALRGRFGAAQTVVSFWPDAPLSEDTTYEVVLPAGGVTDLVGNGLSEERLSVFSTGADVRAPTCRIAATTPVDVDASATLEAADAGVGAQYRWRFGDGEETGPSSERNTSHAWAAPGRHVVTLTVSGPDGRRSCTAIQIVHAPLPPEAPTASSTVAVDEARGLSWVVNPDGGTVAAVGLDDLTVRFEASVGDEPSTVAVDPEGRAWVACRGADRIDVVSPEDGATVQTINLRHGAYPYGIAAAPDGRTMWVSLEGTGELVAIDVATTEATDTIDLVPDALAPRVRGVAVSHDGATVYVTRFVSATEQGEVYAVDVGTSGVATIALAEDPGPDETDSGRGVPNYLSNLAITPDGLSAIVPSKKDNTARGLARDGEPLNTDNTVRTVVSCIDLVSGAEDLAARIDIDDHDTAFAVVVSPSGDLLFVASQGTNRVDVFDRWSGDQIAGFAAGLAPQGLALSGDGRLFVQGFLSRTLEVFDVTGILDGTDTSARSLASTTTVADEPLSPEVLLGKQIFYNADSPQMSLDGYVACASCHLGGGHDGRVWDFTDRGEGLRNTTDLRGRAGTLHGPVHWTGNFDEIQDFENDIRNHFGGAGLLADEDWEDEDRSHPLGAPKAGLSPRLDALAAYVTSLDEFPRSPHRNPDGTMTAEAVAGRAVFESLDCLECHRGERLTDSALDVFHDVGTIRPSSGQRLGGPLPGFDTPTLRGLWSGAPYLHDGSAESLHDVLATEGHGNAQSLTGTDRDALVAFLLQIENEELGYSEADPPGVPGGGGCDCRAITGEGPPSAALLLLLVWLARRRRRDRSP